MKTSNLQATATHAHAIIRGWVGSESAGTDPGTVVNPGMENGTAGALAVGDVVVVDSDGTITTTTTLDDPRPKGIVLDDIDAGEYGPVAFAGPVDLVNVGASVTAGDYFRTSTVAGEADDVATPTSGTFGYFTSSGTTPSGFLTGSGSAVSPGAGGSLPWFNVTDYGAVGDGTTDDAQAFDDAIADLVAAGAGVLYVPASSTSYIISRALDSITVPCTLRGDGINSITAPAGPQSLLEVTSATAQIFTFTDAPVMIRDIAMRNTSAGASAGGAIQIDNGTEAILDGVHLRAFYTGLSIDLGQRWMMTNTSIQHFNKYGIRIRNTTNADAGDWSIDNCIITSTAATGTADACIRIESAGGGKISNVKLGGGDVTRGLDLVAATGISTSILLVSNISAENMTGDGIHFETTGTGSWDYLQVSNYQCGLYSNTTGKAINVVAATAGQIVQVVIDNLTVVSTGGNTNACVDLTNVQNVRIGQIMQSGMGSDVAQSGCTDVVETGHRTFSLGPWYINDIPGSATTQGSLLYFNTATAVSQGAGNQNDPIMRTSGRVIGLFIITDNNRTAGTATARVRVAGTGTTFSSGAVALDGTNTLRDSEQLSHSQGLAFAANQALGVDVVTSGYTPTTGDITLWMIVSLD